ncbi:hypothetical protein MTBPR1_40097 [Candidatus Terasakiella magnetica]|uniref:PAS domain S-box protein n=1 Tax=Candidatus Terasakiella magnetica TaxID=1867952 RepID=A0A1C3RIP0_9PROT|nr:PAS domain S-box protein [Candidatus Terasakiella magnetica]SCA57074.1 hypothetical protein MTBPR1_40097 [Candidatus Terasakiella magnetica]
MNVQNDKKNENEQWLLALLESAPDATLIVDLKGIIHFANKQMESVFGYKNEELIGENVDMLVPQAIRAHHPKMRESFNQTSSVREMGADIVLEGERKGGSTFPIEVSLSPIETDKGKFIATAIRDVTKRRQAEQKIIERERWFRSLLESTPDATLIVDHNGEIQLANRQAEVLFGYSKEEFMGANVDMLVPSSMREHHHKKRESFHQKTAVREMGSGLELEGERKDGTTFPIEVSLSPIEAENGHHVCASIRDITERRLAEKQLNDAYNVIKSSINYAARIQRATLPDHTTLEEGFSEHFVLWEPRDTVGGDFYWNKNWGDGFLLALGDCTGHGVPGAFMTLLSTGALEQALIKCPEGDLSYLAHKTHQLLQATLGQDKSAKGESDDGVEIGICYFSQSKQTLSFVGAHFPIYEGYEGEINEIKSTKQAMGYRHVPSNQQYIVHEIPLKKGANYYLTTDGLIDQIGGPKRVSFGRKRFKALLKDTLHLPLQDQKKQISALLKDYQGDEKRRDDVSVIGFSI